MKIVEWLNDPTNNFPVQRDGDLVKDGVCIGFLTKKLRISQPSVTSHTKRLESTGLVSSKQIKNWVFYKFDQSVLDEFFERAREKMSSWSNDERALLVGLSHSISTAERLFATLKRRWLSMKFPYNDADMGGLSTYCGLSDNEDQLQTKRVRG